MNQKDHDLSSAAERAEAAQAPHAPCLVVGLGASAGGLEAFEHFFARMPPENGMAFVLVQHLAPDRASLLPELLAKYTRMSVRQVEEETPVAPNHVYVIPPDATLTIDRGVLHLVSPPVEPRLRRLPIDSFFRSLAEDQGENAVCILLSGAGADGTRGLRAVKEHGGMAMAQTPASARYDSLVRSAIATGLVDHILPVEEMPARLMEYSTYLTALRATNGPTRPRTEVGDHLHTIHGLLKRQTGHDFSQYKENTIIRRIQRRLQVLQLDAVDAYLTLLKQDPKELDLLFQDLLIGVTQFFRDPEAFAALAREVIPALFADKGADGQVRVGVSGCASGEEAYSIAILLREHLAALDVAPRVQIFATDIDAHALENARRGCYSLGIAEQVSPERLERFFVKHDNLYQVKKELREMCLFSVHSLVKDPPFSRLDLISCRNVLIYLGPELQQKLLRLFHYALRPSGYLFLGPSEALTGQSALFRTLDKKHRLFQKKDAVSRQVVEFPLTDVHRPPQRQEDESKRTRTAAARHIGALAERTILDSYAPACVVTTEQGEAVYFSGRTGRYLEPPTGTPNVNVINMARAGLRLPLRTALQQAVTTHERVVREQIPVQTNGGVQPITLTVQPMTERVDDSTLYLIIFQDVGPAEKTMHAAADAPPLGPEDVHFRSLEHELQATRERLQTTIEELETTNEELSSANEEFQSTNEELETSKEELQSLNEELETVNAELSRKVDDLDRTNSDLQNLLDGTQVATIFLDRELRIRNFTPAIGTLFPLLPGDVGRPFADLAQRFVGSDLVSDAKAVLRTISRCERTLRAVDANAHYLVRIIPYRTIGHVIDGVVLTFVDVTDLKHAEEAAHIAQAYAESLVDTIRDPLLVLDAALHVRSANRSFYQVFQVAPAETEDRLLYKLGNGHWDLPELHQRLGAVRMGDRGLDDFEVEREFPHIGRKTMRLNARQVFTQTADTELVLLAIEDITERKRLEEELVRQAAALQRSNEELQQFGYIVSHDLNEPLRTVANFVSMLAEDYQGKLDAEADGYIAFAVDGAKRMQELIKDLLAYTRVGGGADVFTPVDCAALLMRTLVELQIAIRETGAEVSHDPLPTVPGDAGQLGLVLQNLIENALKFRGSAAPRIHVSARREEHGWRFAVRDNGIGLDARHAERIFQVFQRLHTRREYPGTGIGLTICKKIVERHGGRIWVESTPEQGATFLFTISEIEGGDSSHLSAVR
jgi:two-component system CheB/CheR fusion protein